MTTGRLLHVFPLAVLLVSGASSVTASAQTGARGPGKPPPVKMITIPCCKCLDGSTQTVSINTGANAWTMKPPTGPAQPAPVTTHVAWTTGAAPAQWVGTQSGVQGSYVFELRFHVPNCVIRPTIMVSGIFSADNGGVLTIDTPMPAFNAPPPTAFQSTFPFGKQVVGPGMHTIRVTVNNLGGPVGAVVKGTITVRCPKELVVPDRSDALEAAPDRGELDSSQVREDPGAA